MCLHKKKKKLWKRNCYNLQKKKKKVLQDSTTLWYTDIYCDIVRKWLNRYSLIYCCCISLIQKLYSSDLKYLILCWMFLLLICRLCPLMEVLIVNERSFILWTNQQRHFYANSVFFFIFYFVCKHVCEAASLVPCDGH